MSVPRRVVVVDDHDMFRAGVRSEIGSSVEIVGEGSDVATAVTAIVGTEPDVVLLDVHLPGGGGIEVMKQVHQRHPEVKFLALSVSDAAEDVIGVIRAGARGYVTKNISGTELVDAIGRVADGDAVFSPRLAGFVLDAFSGAIDIAVGRRGPGPPVPARTGGPPPDRPRLRVQGGGPRTLHLGEDGRNPRLLGPPQTPTLQPPRTDPLGHRPPPGLNQNNYSETGQAVSACPPNGYLWPGHTFATPTGAQGALPLLYRRLSWSGISQLNSSRSSRRSSRRTRSTG